MEKILLSTILLAVIMCFTLSCSSEDNDAGKDTQAEDVEVSDASNTGCLTRSDYDPSKAVGAIVLKKEGDIISCELRNYESVCGTSDFNVDMKNVAGKGSVDSLLINVSPVLPEHLADCYCPYNISFTIRNIKSSSLYLKCWWFDGIVSFGQSNMITLEDIQTDATIDGVNYKLHETMHRALLTVWNCWEGELVIPSEVSYNGKSYIVTDLYPVFRSCKTLTKVTLPSTLKRLSDEDNSYMNPFPGCSSLEAIEVDKANPWLCSVDGVLFSKDMTWIICYPAASKRFTYTVPASVRKIVSSAFYGCDNLKTLYVPASEIEMFKGAFSGTILPI